MVTAWALNAIGLYVTTVGALLIFLYLWAAPRFAQEIPSPGQRRAYVRHQRLLMVAVGLLSAWLIVQYVSLIVL